MKNFLKIAFAITILAFILISTVQYKGTKYSYLDVFKLKASSILRSSFYENEKLLRTDDPNKIVDLELPEIELLYKKKTRKYFTKLWEGYEQGSNSVTYTKEGIEYYKKHRAWKKAKLVFKGDTLNVRIRAHGIEPDGHHEGKYFSLQVKTKKGKQFKGRSKFKLIIYERLGFHINLLQKYHEKFSLLWAKPEELVKLNINGRGYKLFYIEDYGVKVPEDLGPLKRLEIHGYKSGAEVLALPSQWVAPSIKQSGNDSLEKVRLLQLNQVLLERDSIKIIKFFDEDYLIKYLVVKAIFGYSGHECYPGNWYMYYDTTSQHFYPALSREPNLMTLNKEVSLKNNLIYYNHPVEDRSSLRLNLYSVLLANPDFYNKFKNVLKITITNEKNALIKDWWEAKLFHQEIVKGSLLLSALKVEMKLKDIETNLEILEELLSERD